MLEDKIFEVDDETNMNIENHHTELFQGVIGMLQTLCKVVKDVRVKVSKKEAWEKEASPSDDHSIEVQKS